jgi:hypothetical protein
MLEGVSSFGSKQVIFHRLIAIGTEHFIQNLLQILEK